MVRNNLSNRTNEPALTHVSSCVQVSRVVGDEYRDPYRRRQVNEEDLTAVRLIHIPGLVRV